MTGYVYTRLKSLKGGSSSDSEIVELEDSDSKAKADASALLSYTSTAGKPGDESFKSGLLSESKKGKKKKGVNFGSSVPSKGKAPGEPGYTKTDNGNTFAMQNSKLGSMLKRVDSYRKGPRDQSMLDEVNNRPDLDLNLEDPDAVASYVETWLEANSKHKPRTELFHIEERGMKDGKMTYDTVWHGDLGKDDEE